MAIFQKVDDKAYHVFAGILITVLTGFVLYRYINCMALISGTVAFLTGCVAGLVKELIDKHIRKKEFSVPDLISTAWGAIIGGICLIPYYVTN